VRAPRQCRAHPPRGQGPGLEGLIRPLLAGMTPVYFTFDVFAVVHAQGHVRLFLLLLQLLPVADGGSWAAAPLDKRVQDATCWAAFSILDHGKDSIDWELQGRDMSVLSVLDQLFLVVCLIELLLQVVANGLDILRKGWYLFDFLVIVAGVCSQWVLKPTMPRSQLTKISQQVLVLRMMRLLKLVRAVRLVSSFRALWKLTQSFMQRAPTMASALLMMLMTIYIFACVGVEFTAKGEWTEEEVRDLVRTRYSSLPLTMLSLLQFVTGDSISGLYYPSSVQKSALCIYFVVLLISENCKLWRSGVAAPLHERL